MSIISSLKARFLEIKIRSYDRLCLSEMYCPVRFNTENADAAAAIPGSPYFKIYFTIKCLFLIMIKKSWRIK